MRKLTMADITDLRAYEKEREAFRDRVIAAKKKRRQQLGDLMTITFENRDTMRFQVQEMARAERMLQDEQIQHEIDEYNELIPDEDELCGTLFIEINDKKALYEWLPKLVGIQRAVLFRLADGSEVRGEPLNEERLTREETTSTVHFLTFGFTPEQAKQFEQGGASVVVDHPNYRAEAKLDDAQRAELAKDLRGED